MLNILPLFPIPVTISKLERQLSTKELKFVQDQELSLRTNEGNFTSIDTEVLEKDDLSNLKEWILQNVNDYFSDILNPQGNVEPYITLSWLNYTYKDGYHHRHSHGNSVVSGVFYIQTTDDDKIWFFNEKHKNIELTPKEFNMYNSSSWWIPAEQNTLVLFPSELMHSVNQITKEESRISLSFNVFVRGEFGNKGDLKWLSLK